jgi:hypothetical protein
MHSRFAEGATELATQCTIEWYYKLAPAIKGFKFMTHLDG